jgi:hypothetical protein
MRPPAVSGCPHVKKMKAINVPGHSWFDATILNGRWNFQTQNYLFPKLFFYY